ncbi:multiple epidermal growth factor-like domains protein 6 [Saccostrea cucullata]|uniref:multiple epidermal growth factor-like domains protein 6 n=1 Tax=Saccostrea cuccullata TaxID=36930 RepID=UPI002ED48394
MDVDSWTCFSSLLFLWIMSISFTNCYEQLINTRTTKVTSSSIHPFGRGRGSADFTIDGNFNQHYTNCMHTAIGWSEAWLTIDLGVIYNVKSVKIWYRDDSGSARAFRLTGFSILASQTPGFEDNNICYQDPGHVLPETVLEVNCVRTARYIKIYTNKKNDQYGAILEICEIRIFGCPRRKYGEQCESCGNCKRDCHATGQCDSFGCIHDGYHPPYCKACEAGSFGKNCLSECGHCANNATCNSVKGSCPDGNCAPGWIHNINRKCNQACKDGWYGRECKEQCGYCRGNRPSHHVTGSCLALCEPGYHGDKCEESEFSQLLAIQRKILNSRRELLPFKRRRIELRANGTSPTDFI